MCFCTHWGSGEIVEDVRTALASEAGRGRWTDEEYLARIVFDVMIGKEQGGETGFGISTGAHGDLDFPPIVINCKKQTVKFPPIYRDVSFAEFVGDA